MKNLVVILLCFAFYQLANAADAPPVVAKKSSAIPDKREFPIDDAIQPCNDFYKYACDKVLDTFELREDRSTHDFAFSDSDERILDFKKKYFSALASQPPQSDREAGLKNVYLACMNADGRAKEEKAMVKEIKHTLESKKDRDQLLAFFQSNILSQDYSLIDFSHISNQQSPTKNDLYMDVDLMTYPEKTYYEKPENLKDLEEIVYQFFKTIDESKAREKAQMIVAFEKDFANVYPTPVEWRDLTSSPAKVTKAELIAKYPNFKIDSFLGHVPDDTLIRDFTPKTFEFMQKKLGEMSLDDLKSLYEYQALAPYLDDAYPDFFKQRFAFIFKHLAGPKVRPVREERCTTLVMRKYAKELDSILWPRLFKDFPKARVVGLAERIRTSILTALKKNKWLSAQAKKEATRKIKSMRLQLVSPENDDEWDFNPAATYSEKNPIANAKQLNLLLKNKILDELKKPMNPYRWGFGPLTVNAYYSRDFNKFVLPVGILQPPFFDQSLSDEENLGGLGVVIGHEMGHSIDDQGAKYDADGVLKSWRTEKDAKEFTKRTSKLVEQFNHAGHNGQLTLGENIGDNVGLTAAFAAASTNKAFDQAKQKGFFLQYAHLWCSTMRPSFQEMQLKTNPHALGWARTNEQIKQQAGFKKAYACKDGDGMTLPAGEMVHIWQ